MPHWESAQSPMAYLAELDSNGLSLRSIRMYLSTANQFASAVGLSQLPWMQGQIERFVDRNPGTRNNLSRFVSFCRKSRGWEVAMPPRGSSVLPIKDPIKSASKLAKLIKKVDAVGLHHSDRTLLEKILATALGIPANAVELLSPTTLQVAEAGISLVFKHELIVLPLELVPYGQRLYHYLRESQAA